MKPCIHCGAELPDEANLCTHCGKTQTEAVPEKPPRRWRRKLTIALAVLLAVGLAVFFVQRHHAPKVYETDTEELLYSDSDGSYRVFLSYRASSKTTDRGMFEKTVMESEGNESAHPTLLYVYDLDREENLTTEFTDKVAKVEIFCTPGENSRPLDIFEPTASPDFPHCAMAADMVYSALSGTNDITWVLHMKNGDTLRLKQRFIVLQQKTAVYSPDNWKMETIEDLQALMRHIEETETPDTYVTVFLPPLTYEGGLQFTERSCKLVGTVREDRRTTFTGGFTVSLRDPQIAEFEGICFLGDGSGTGISASEAVRLNNCVVSGWEVGVYAHDGSWIEAVSSVFENNGIGYLFDSRRSNMTAAVFEEDSFLNNGTGMSLVMVPGAETLSFPDCVFSGNGVNIDNQAGQNIDLKDAAQVD